MNETLPEDDEKSNSASYLQRYPLYLYNATSETRPPRQTNDDDRKQIDVDTYHSITNQLRPHEILSNTLKYINGVWIVQQTCQLQVQYKKTMQILQH